MGGTGIFVVRHDDPNRNSIVETISELGTRSVMAQRYIPEIKDGDKRVLLIDGKLVPHCLARIPKPGESRGNLAAGARGVAQPLTARHREIADALGPVLAKRGLAAGRPGRDRRLAHRGERHQPDLLPRDPGPDGLRRLRNVPGFFGTKNRMIGVLIVTHGSIGEALLTSAAQILGERAAAGGDAQRLARTTTRTTSCCARASCSTGSTRATACWCSPTSSAPRRATWCRACSRTAASRASPGASLPMLLRVLTGRNGSLARGGQARAFGRRRGRGPHEQRSLPRCLASPPRS